MSPPLLLWAVAFVWTLALELPVYTWLLRDRFAAWWAPVALTVGVDVATHPALWYVFPRFGPWPLWLAVAEGCVVIVEALLIAAVLRLQSKPACALGRAAWASLLANATSTAGGLVLMPLLA